MRGRIPPSPLMTSALSTRRCAMRASGKCRTSGSSSRCCTAFAAICSAGWCARDSGCASTCRMARRGTRTSCGAWRSVRPMRCSFCEICSAPKAPSGHVNQRRLPHRREFLFGGFLRLEDTGFLDLLISANPLGKRQDLDRLGYVLRIQILDHAQDQILVPSDQGALRAAVMHPAERIEGRPADPFHARQRPQDKAEPGPSVTFRFTPNLRSKGGCRLYEMLS